MRKIKVNDNKVIITIIKEENKQDEYYNTEVLIKKAGYKIQNLEFAEYIKIEELKEKIKETKLKYGINSRIGIMTDSNKLIISAYVYLEEDVNDFIFFIGKEENNLEVLYSDVKIENLKLSQQPKEEKVKIYTNIEFNNIINKFDFFVENNNFKYFENIEKINGNSLKYKIKNREENKIEFYDRLFENKYFIVFYIIGLLRKYGLDNTRKITVDMFKYFQLKTDADKQEIAENIYSTKGIVFLEFREKMAIFSLLVLLEMPFVYLMKFITMSLKSDNQGNERYYPAIIADLFMYMNHNKLATYKSFREDMKMIMEKIDMSVRKNLFIRNIENYNKNSKKIVFLVDSITYTNYSVAKITFDMVKNIKKYYPEYEIIIYVENNYSFIEEEKIMLYSNLLNNVSSEKFVNEHRTVLDEAMVELVYSKPIASKDSRVKEMIASIIAYNPEIIITTTLCSCSLNTLYNYFPTLYISMVDMNEANKFDVQLYPHIELIKKTENYKNKKLEDYGIYSFEYGAEFYKKPQDYYKREQFNIKKEDIIMVTVGIRLRGEISERFVDMIAEVLRENSNAKWYLIGLKELKVIDEKYNYLVDKQIFYIYYEEKLGEFYNLCDIYLNPLRDGGGFSMAEAIVNDVPIVTHIQSSAGKHYCGQKQCVNSDIEYIEEMKSMIENKEYRKNKLDLQKENLKKFEYHGIINKLIGFIEKAKDRYSERKNIFKNN